MIDLPQSVLDMVEMVPMEDVLLPLMREAIPDISIQTKIEDDQTFPFIMLRCTGAYGSWDGDERFLDSGTVVFHVFTSGLNDDEDAALLSEAVRVAMRDCLNKVTPNGHVSKTRLLYKAKRQPDWATATGPVQYADLPTGVTRYESSFYVEIRRPLDKPYSP